MSIYLFLRERTHWTKYDTLKDRDFWRKPDPPDGTIERGLRRLQAELREIETAAVSLLIDPKHRRTKLDK